MAELRGGHPPSTSRRLLGQSGVRPSWGCRLRRPGTDPPPQQDQSNGQARSAGGPDSNQNRTDGPQAVAARIRCALHGEEQRYDQRGHDHRNFRIAPRGRSDHDYTEYDQESGNLPRLVRAVEVTIGSEVLCPLPPQPTEAVSQRRNPHQRGCPQLGTRQPGASGNGSCHTFHRRLSRSRSCAQY
jgi:hypothetical protein